MVLVGNERLQTKRETKFQTVCACAFEVSEHVRRVIEVVGGWVTQTVEWSSATERERCSKSRSGTSKSKSITVVPEKDCISF